MPKGNPNPSPATRFKKGRSGNPCGMSSRHRELIAENAIIATEIRNKMLAAIAARLKEDTDGGLTLTSIGADTLRLLKDAEDRGFGTPKASVDISNPDGSLQREPTRKEVIAALSKIHGSAKPKRK